MNKPTDEYNELLSGIMKNTFRIILFGFLIVASTQRAMAGPIAFDFVFQDVAGSRDNAVMGIISGLFDDGVSRAASSVEVTSNSGGFGLGEYVGDPPFNSFKVQNGVIVAANFLSRGALNTTGVMCCTLDIGAVSDSAWYGALTESPGVSTATFQSTVTFTLRAASPVPVPATLALLGVGLLGLCVSRRKRKLQN